MPARVILRNGTQPPSGRRLTVSISDTTIEHRNVHCYRWKKAFTFQATINDVDLSMFASCGRYTTVGPYGARLHLVQPGRPDLRGQTRRKPRGGWRRGLVGLRDLWR